MTDPAPRYTLAEYDLLLGALLEACKKVTYATGMKLSEQALALRALLDVTEKVMVNRDAEHPKTGD